MSPRLKDYGAELFRLEKEFGPTQVSQWTKKQVSVRDTGVVLEKRLCRLWPSRNHPEGLKAAWSWKVVKRLKPQEIQGFCRKLEENGWQVLKGARRLQRTRKTKKIRRPRCSVGEGMVPPVRSDEREEPSNPKVQVAPPPVRRNEQVELIKDKQLDEPRPLR